jgi:hypothetical protein
MKAGWIKIEDENPPEDGHSFLAFGIHDTDYSSDRGQHWAKGDHWMGIILYDIWRSPSNGGAQFVFSKDGTPLWAPITHWQHLEAPE